MKRTLSSKNSNNVVDLDQHRIQADREFEDNAVAYVEALWGERTFAFNAMIRDMEAMRRGEDDGSLRPPVTDYEVGLLVTHVRALANDLARHCECLDLIRPEDDLKDIP